MGECTWLYGEWPNLGVGVRACMGSGQILGWVYVLVWGVAKSWVGVVVWGVTKSWGGWVWLYREGPNHGWVGVVVWGGARSELLNRDG